MLSMLPLEKYSPHNMPAAAMFASRSSRGARELHTHAFRSWKNTLLIHPHTFSFEDTSQFCASGINVVAPQRRSRNSALWCGPPSNGMGNKVWNFLVKKLQMTLALRGRQSEVIMRLGRTPTAAVGKVSRFKGFGLLCGAQANGLKEAKGADRRYYIM